ncbi:MAG: hypothetical protein EBU75_05000 [Betaproteobacteria bacterium]|jgi:DNA-binding MarR family transcriptional regulator|nr:hypothetical protein [Betaproteobacteria bacterium]
MRRESFAQSGSSGQIALSNLLLLSRQSLLKHLYRGNSGIPIDLLLLIFSNHAHGREPMSVKALLSALPYSPMGARYHLYSAARQGLLTLSRDERDKRILRVTPSEKLFELFRRVEEDLRPYLKADFLSLRA